MTHCADCKNWTTRIVTRYTDGSEIIHYEGATEEMPYLGRCSALDDLETKWTFGCNEFTEGSDHTKVLKTKEGSPWQHSHAGPCPDCKGAGSSEDAGAGCYRCVGTGKVRYYDDGFIGEERTRKHPKELEHVIDQLAEVLDGTTLAPLPKANVL